jgi:hypothetical protein
MERTVFYIQHQIKIAMQQTPELDENWKARFSLERSLLQRLGSTLKILAFEKHMDLERLVNTTIYFGPRSGIDLIGRIGLRISDTESQWVDELFNVDRDRIDAIKDGSADRFDLEKDFSDFVGFDYVYTDYALGGSSRYASYLASLKKEAEAQNFRLEDGELLRLRILDSTNPNDLKIDTSDCTLAVPIQLSPDEVIKALKDQSQDLIMEHRKLSQAQEELNAMVLSAKRKYRLRAFTWDPTLSRAQLLTCTTSIIRYSVQLFKYLEGQRVKITNDYHLDETDGTIHIRWDFMI